MRTSVEIALVVILVVIGGFFLLDGAVKLLDHNALLYVVGVQELTLAAVALGAVAIVNAIHRSKER